MNIIKGLKEILLIIFIISFASVGGAIGKDLYRMYLSKKSKISEDEQVRLIKLGVENNNKNLPQMISNEIQLESEEYIPDFTILYNYKLVKISKSDIDIEMLNKYWVLHTINYACDDKGVQRNFKLGISHIYVYKSKEGQEIFRVGINKDICRAENVEQRNSMMAEYINRKKTNDMPPQIQKVQNEPKRLNQVNSKENIEEMDFLKDKKYEQVAEEIDEYGLYEISKRHSFKKWLSNQPNYVRESYELNYKNQNTVELIKIVKEYQRDGGY